MADPMVQQQQIEYQTGFAPQVAPYAERLLGGAESTLFEYARDPQGNIILDESQMPKIAGFKPYMQYQGERFAGFTPLQQQAFAGAQAMQAAPQLADASALAGQAGLQALAYNQYQPGQFGNFYRGVQSYQPTAFTAPGVAARDLQTYQMSPAERVSSRDLTAPQMAAARTGYAPSIQAYQMGAAERVAGLPSVSSRDIQAAQTGYRPDIQAYQMGPAERVSAQQVGTPLMSAAQTSYRPDLQTFQMGPTERIRTQSFARPGSA